MRAQALETAIAQRRWDDALKIDPGNPTALIGLALGKLGGDAAAVAAAFKDLEAAEARGATMPEFAVARAEAIAARGREQAKAGRVPDAEKDYSEAKRLWAAMPPDTLLLLPPLRNSIGIEVKLIPAGKFTMGEAGGDSDEKPHEVTLTKPFYLGVYEVTNAQWERVMGSVHSRWKDGDRPVEGVKWADAVEFCRRLSALPAERKAGRKYRLPTEAEWEYACRAGTRTKYSFGENKMLFGDYGWFEANSGATTHPVGQKKPNGWGLYDMYGNVYEWCSDWYGDYPDGSAIDPKGSSFAPGDLNPRVFRGCSWRSSDSSLRSANRCRDAVLNEDHLGFRLALSPPGVDPLEEVGK